MEEGNSTTTPATPARKPSMPHLILINVTFIFGAVGNIAALWILYKSAKSRNKKHVFLLRSLACNDLLAQIGMLTLVNLQKNEIIPTYWGCVGYVLFRAFGIGSGCVAFVMALERWLALTRPFLYQQLVTYRILKRFTICLWCGGALLTYLPLFGFGLYYTKEKCHSYREAQELKDKIYAYLFLFFGSCLCLCIAFCNITVIVELSRIRSQNRILIRRVSRSTINNRMFDCHPAKFQTPEEEAFAKLMAIICIIFLVCWVPQLILIVAWQFCGAEPLVFGQIANMLTCVYLTLDPYVYVLQRYREQGKKIILPCFNCKTNVPEQELTSPGTPTTTTVLLSTTPSYDTPAVL